MSCRPGPRWAVQKKIVLVSGDGGLVVAVLECIGHKQNSLHARLPTEPILEIYDKQENGGVAEGE